MDSITSLLSSRANDLALTPNQNQITITQSDETQTDEIQISEINTNDTPIVNTKITEEKPISNLPDINQIKNTIYNIKNQLDQLLRILGEENIQISNYPIPENPVLDSGERIIEGAFNGEKMVGPDGKEYPMPPNYASKSKLVEGDMMKLTITHNGSFIYKQLKPIGRRRLIGELVTHHNTQQWGVLADGKSYKILTASVTFYKGRPGDEVIILIPRDGDSNWGAVENIIKI